MATNRMQYGSLSKLFLYSATERTFYGVIQGVDFLIWWNPRCH